LIEGIVFGGDTEAVWTLFEEAFWREAGEDKGVVHGVTVDGIGKCLIVVRRWGGRKVRILFLWGLV